MITVIVSFIRDIRIPTYQVWYIRSTTVQPMLSIATYKRQYTFEPTMF